MQLSPTNPDLLNAVRSCLVDFSLDRLATTRDWELALASYGIDEEDAKDVSTPQRDDDDNWFVDVKARFSRQESFLVVIEDGSETGTFGMLGRVRVYAVIS